MLLILSRLIIKYEIRYDNNAYFAETNTIEEARKIVQDYNSKFVGKSLHIYKITTYIRWNKRKVG